MSANNIYNLRSRSSRLALPTGRARSLDLSTVENVDLPPLEDISRLLASSRLHEDNSLSDHGASSWLTVGKKGKAVKKTKAKVKLTMEEQLNRDNHDALSALFDNDNDEDSDHMSESECSRHSSEHLHSADSGHLSESKRPTMRTGTEPSSWDKDADLARPIASTDVDCGTDPLASGRTAEEDATAGLTWDYVRTLETKARLLENKLLQMGQIMEKFSAEANSDCSEGCVALKAKLQIQASAAEEKLGQMEERMAEIERKELLMQNNVRVMTDMVRENSECQEKLLQAAHEKTKLEETISGLQKELAKWQKSANQAQGVKIKADTSPAQLKELENSLRSEIRAVSNITAPMMKQVHVVLKDLAQKVQRPSRRDDTVKTTAPKFSGKGESVDIFLEMFKRYCMLNGIPDDMRADVLLACVNESVYAVLHKAGVTKKPDWTSVTKTLRKVYDIVKKTKDWRAELFAVVRKTDESLIELAHRIQYLGEKSGIDCPPDLLMERFIAAVGNAPWARWLQTVTSTFGVTNLDTVVSLATDMERNNKTSKTPNSFQVAACAMDEQVAEATPDAPVADCNAVQSAPSASQPTNTDLTKLLTQMHAGQQKMIALLENLQKSNATKNSNQQSTPASSGPRRNNQRRQGDEPLTCHRCKSTEHLVRQCSLPCQNCGKHGHTDVVCRAPKNATRDAQTPQ